MKVELRSKLIVYLEMYPELDVICRVNEELFSGDFLWVAGEITGVDVSEYCILSERYCVGEESILEELEDMYSERDLSENEFDKMILDEYEKLKTKHAIFIDVSN